MNSKTPRSVCQSPNAPSPIRAGRPRNPAIDVAIQEAAKSLLAEVGCGAFTMEGVAARAGIGKQTLYRRWPSRGDLLIDLFYLDELQEPEIAPDLPAAEALGAYLDASLQRLYRPWNRNLLRSLAVTAQDDPLLREVMLARITWPRVEMGRAILRRLKAAGQVRADLDVEMAVDMANGAIWFHLLFMPDPIDAALRDRILRELLALAAVPSLPG
ncbi:TetR/AcrR family transcriptional regulator [Roseococcus pinisoli]|uniref:TetR/AcrR family transcriptional regulator n=1 Tax=Roseococcus pinisoli TaxID=2835040 RepID=UPI0020C04361|nr:TetR/AcrR family transcriptional regulator [Roseococcus pinisoli]